MAANPYIPMKVTPMIVIFRESPKLSNRSGKPRISLLDISSLGVIRRKQRFGTREPSPEEVATFANGDSGIPKVTSYVSTVPIYLL